MPREPLGGPTIFPSRYCVKRSLLPTSQARTRRRTKATSERTVEILPLLRCRLDPTTLLLGTPTLNKCALHDPVVFTTQWLTRA
jgi:hypothetical protein